MTAPKTPPAQGQDRLAQLFDQSPVPWTYSHVFERAFDKNGDAVVLSQADVIDLAHFAATISHEHRAGLLAGTHVVVPRKSTYDIRIAIAETVSLHQPADTIYNAMIEASQRKP